MRSQVPSLLIAIVLIIPCAAGAQDPPLADSILTLDHAAAVSAVQARPAETRAAIETMQKRFDDSIRSDRSRPEQRRVQYDNATLDRGLQLAGLYAEATQDGRPLRALKARQQRIEGTVLLNDRKYAEAVKKLNAALAEAEQLGDVWLQIITHTNLAYGYIELGDKEAASRACQRAYAIAEQSSDTRSRALTTLNVATMAMHVGDYSQVITYARTAATLAHEVGIKIWEGNALLSLGIAYREQGDRVKAREALISGRDVLLQTQDKLGTGRVFYNLAMVDAELGDVPAAIAEMERSLPIIREVDIRHSHQIDETRPGENPIEETALDLLARWHAQVGHAQQAKQYQADATALRARHPDDDAPAHAHP